ncbi:hypothetical protein ACVR1I_05340 [Streptococcus cameli]
MKKKNTILIDSLVLVLSFLILRWIFMNFLYNRFVSIFGFPASGVDFWRPLGAILLLTLVFFVSIRLLYKGKINRPSYLFFIYPTFSF